MKMLGVAAVMALALTVTVGAASASADGFVASKYPATVGGEINGGHVIGNSYGEVSCGAWGLNFAGSLEQPSGTVTTSTENAGCSLAGAAFTMKMNGCGLVLHPGEDAIEIGPKGCGSITMTWPVVKCEVRIPAQTGLEASFVNDGSDEVDVEMAASGIEMIVKGGSCGAETTVHNGYWTGDWNVFAMYGAEQVDLQVGPLPTGIFVSGGQFDAEAFPVSINGQTASSHQFGTAYGTVACSNSQFAGSLIGASGQLSLQPTYSTCTTKGIAGTKINPNGCTYDVNASGAMGIACPPSKSLEIKTMIAGVTKCTITVPAQGGLSAVSLANQGSGFERVIGTTFSLASVSYSQQAGTGAGACASGSFANGTYSGTVTLSGLS